MAVWAAYATHRDIFFFKRCQLPEDIGVQLMYSVNFDIYGADTWTLTKQEQNKLAAAHTKMENYA